MRAIQLVLIDTDRSMHSLSVLLSAVKTSLRVWTALEIVQWAMAAINSTQICNTTHGCYSWGCLFTQSSRLCSYYLMEASICEWRLFHSELLFEGGKYSRVASNRRNTVDSPDIQNLIFFHYCNGSTFSTKNTSHTPWPSHLRRLLLQLLAKY